MKIKSLLLALVIAASVCMLPSCTKIEPSLVETTSPSQMREDVLDEIKHTSGEFKVYDVSGFIGKKYIFKNKSGIFTQKNSRIIKPPALVRNKYITSYMTNGKLVMYTAYEDENDPKGRKLRSGTQLFCVRTDGTGFKKIAHFNNANLFLLGYCNGSVYFTGDKTYRYKSQSIYSYSFSDALLLTRRTGLKNVMLKGSRIFYNYYYEGDMKNVGLYAMNIADKDKQDVRIADSAYSEDYSDSKSEAAFWSHNYDRGFDKFNGDHYLYIYKNGSVTKSVKFPDKTIPLAYVSASGQALAYFEDSKNSGVYLFDVKTGNKTFVSDTKLQYGLQKNIQSKYTYFIVNGSGAIEDIGKSDSHIYRLQDNRLVEVIIPKKSPDFNKGTIIIDKWVRYRDGKLRSYRLYEKAQTSGAETTKSATAQ